MAMVQLPKLESVVVQQQTHPNVKPVTSASIDHSLIVIELIAPRGYNDNFIQNERIVELCRKQNYYSGIRQLECD